MPGDKSGMAAVMGDTGILLRIQGKLQDALNHFQKALELSNLKWDIVVPPRMAMSAIGDVLLEEGDLPGAYKMYQQASAIDHEIGSKDYLRLKPYANRASASATGQSG